MAVDRLWRKRYGPDTAWQKQREATFLMHLEGRCKGEIRHHFPRLCYVFVPDALIMTDCGRQIDPVVDRDLLPEIVRQMERVVLPLLETARIVHRDITKHNLLWRSSDETACLIDFGWSRWEWEEETPVPLPEVMAGMRVPDREQWELLKKEWGVGGLGGAA